MTEADILALTYTDTCTVYRPCKVILDTGESTWRKGLEGDAVYTGVPCALSSPSGGKLQQGTVASKTPMDYLLFTRPEIDIAPGDTVVVRHLGQDVITCAGLPERQPSHNNTPLTLVRDAV